MARFASSASPLARPAPIRALPWSKSAATAEGLAEILAQISDHGAVPTALADCQLTAADMDGAFPEGFYSSTNQRTEVRTRGQWIEVERQEMDCGIEVDVEGQSARCVPMIDVHTGMNLVVGHSGVRVFPQERSMERQSFEFMNSAVSTEKPKGVAIRQIAHELFKNRATAGKTLVVGGPAIVHTGSGEHLCRMIRDGYVNKLFAGNALATHDIEQSLFGTSLGVHLEPAKWPRPGTNITCERSTASVAPAAFTRQWPAGY